MSVYNKESSPVGEIMISSAKGLAVSVIAAAVMLFAFTAIAYGNSDPDSLTAPLGYAALYIAAMVAGGCSARFSGDTGTVGILSGAVSGIMLLFLLILMSFMPAEAPSEPLSPMITVLMYAAIPAAAAVAGIIFRKRQVRRVKHKKRR